MNEPVRVERLRFDYSRFPVQIWHDGWRNVDRIMRYTGKCVICGRSTWAFDDGENDPRGALGDHALCTTDFTDDNGKEWSVITCFSCQDTYETYQVAIKHGERAVRAVGAEHLRDLAFVGVVPG